MLLLAACHLWLFSLHSLNALAQEYEIPTQWLAITSSISRDERIQRSQDVLDSLSDRYDPNTGKIQDLLFVQNGQLISAMASHDMVSSTSKNRDVVQERYFKVMSQPPQFPDKTPIGDALTWGLTAVYSYRTYQEQSFMDSAIDVWEMFTPWMITTDDASVGIHPMRAAHFKSQCNDSASVAGGVFADIYDTYNLMVTAEPTGRYMMLSAYLFEITHNQTYRHAASLSQNFIQSYFRNLHSGVLHDAIFLSNCTYPNELLISYNSGLYLEAVSVFGDATGDVQLLDIANRLTTSLVHQYTSSSGMCPGHDNNRTNDPEATGSAFMFRGLYEHWARSQSNSGITNLVQAFFLIQYNSLIMFSQTPGKPYYSPSWSGPPLETMISWSQLNAIDILNSVVSMAVTEPTTSSSESSTSTPSGFISSIPGLQGEGGSHRSTLGATVGGIIGGITALALFIATIIILLKRRRSIRGTQVPCDTHESELPGRSIRRRLGNSSFPLPPDVSQDVFDEIDDGSSLPYYVEPYPSSPDITGPPPRYKEVVQ